MTAERSEVAPAAKGARFDALDDLRGVSILAMMLSGVIPFGVLSRWMYHAQTPPPTHAHNPDLPGITWVDLVFPFFLFAMGAAIPLALGRRMEGGASPWRAAGQALLRGGLLIAFALYDQHVRPYGIANPPTDAVWWTALGAFFLAFPMFARLPDAWPKWAVVLVRVLGWGGAWLLVSRLPHGKDPAGFSWTRSDVILLVLATCATVSTLVWLATRSSWPLRLFALGLVAAWRLGAENDGSWTAVSWWWEEGTVAQIVRPEFLGYLLVVIPGTMAGDLLRRTEPSDGPLWRRIVTTLGGLAAPAVAVHVWFHRDPPWVLLPFLALPLVAAPGRTRELARLGAAFLAMAILLEPFQDGIKKDPPTFAYWLGGAGLATLFLVGLDGLPRFPGRRLATLTGQNPMLAYLGVTNLVAPLWALTIGGWVAERTPTPDLGVLRAWLQTLLLALLVAGFTRLRVVLRT